MRGEEDDAPISAASCLPTAYCILHTYECHRWDSNPHSPDSETGASCQLGYRGELVNLFETVRNVSS